ncbi:hypothetical protein [Sphingobacterium siyangense]|jgi:hypothetical protein|uniref:hypothetical protein n=1 Tax=Sphingobacterium siyangense TaxID=459529 RepID=UPI003C720BA2
MKIELKNIQHFSSLSEETEAFMASIYVNGSLAGYAENEGKGGETNYYPKDERGQRLISRAEEFAKSLQNRAAEDPLQNLAFEQMINKILYTHLKEKQHEEFNRQLQEISKKAIVIGMPYSYYYYFKLNHPIADYLLRQDRIEMLKNILKTEVLPELKPDEKILNKNIPVDVLRAAGMKDEKWIIGAQDKNDNSTELSPKNTGRRR